MRIPAAILCFFLIFGLFFADAEARSRRKAKEDKVKWVKSKHGLGALLKLSKDRAKMEREYQKETASYKKAKKALEAGHLKVGESTDHVRKKLGDPVIELTETDGKSTRWVYKPATADYFTGSKVYLIFDESGKLTKSWEMPAKNSTN